MKILVLTTTGNASMVHQNLIAITTENCHKRFKISCSSGDSTSLYQLSCCVEVVYGGIPKENDDLQIGTIKIFI